MSLILNRRTNTDARSQRSQGGSRQLQSTLNQLELPEGCEHLASSIAEPENLRLAWDTLAADGGDAAGPNGAHYDDFTNREIWEIVRALSKIIKERRYCVGAIRRVLVPKGGNRGYRTISIMNIEDRVVHRAVSQLLQPLAERLFDPRSFGGRPWRNPWHAVAHADLLVRSEKHLVWITEDIKSAFDQVPLGRMMDVVRLRFPDRRLCKIVERVIEYPKRSKGLRQGSSLSLLLMNLYLDHFLDRRWRRLHPNVPLLRYVDDILLMCPASEDPQRLYQDLRRMLEAAAMPLKGCPENAIQDVSTGQTVRWLGYDATATVAGVKLHVPISDASGEWRVKLSEKLMLAHTKKNPPQAVRNAIRSMFEYFGPCYPHSDQQRAYELVRSLAEEYAFEEFLPFGPFKRQWHNAYYRFKNLQTLVDAEFRSARSKGCSSQLGAARSCADTSGQPSTTPVSRRGSMKTNRMN